MHPNQSNRLWYYLQKLSTSATTQRIQQSLEVISNPGNFNLDRLVNAGKSLAVDIESVLEQNKILQQALDGAQAQSKLEMGRVANANELEKKLGATRKELAMMVEGHRRVEKQLTVAQDSLHRLEAERGADIQIRSTLRSVQDELVRVEQERDQLVQKLRNFQREQSGETVDYTQKIVALEARVANLRGALQRSKKMETDGTLALEKEKGDRKADHEAFIKRQLVVMAAVDKSMDDMRAKVFESWSVALPQELSRKRQRV